MNSGCILLQCTDTGSCAYEHQIKGSGAPGNHSYINGNVPVQWCDIPGWELAWSTKREHTAGRDFPGWCCFWRESRGVGAQRTRLSQSLLRLDSEGKEDPGAGTEPVTARRNFVTSADKGREKEPCRTASQRATPRSGHPQVLLMLLPGCVIVSWVHYNTAGTEGRQCSQTRAHNSVQTNTSGPLSLHRLPWDSSRWPICSSKNWIRSNYIFLLFWFRGVFCCFVGGFFSHTRISFSGYTIS